MKDGKDKWEITREYVTDGLPSAMSLLLGGLVAVRGGGGHADRHRGHVPSAAVLLVDATCTIGIGQYSNSFEIISIYNMDSESNNRLIGLAPT